MILKHTAKNIFYHKLSGYYIKKYGNISMIQEINSWDSQPVCKVYSIQNCLYFSLQKNKKCPFFMLIEFKRIFF